MLMRGKLPSGGNRKDKIELYSQDCYFTDRRAHGGDPHHLGGPTELNKIGQWMLDMRARNIKPGFFKNEDLAETGPYGQILFAGLWGLADREGKLEDRPKRIKAEIFPYYDPNPGVDELLDLLGQRDLIIRYSVDGRKYLKIINFLKHQSPHHNETESSIPDPLPTLNERTSNHGEKPFQPKREALPPDSLNPDSLNPESPNPDPLITDSLLKSAKPKESKQKEDAQEIKPVDLLDLWNEMKPIPTLKYLKMTAERLKKIQARLRKNSDLEYWKKVFQGVSESPFLRGDNGTFKATLDWLIKNDTNSQKVYEGQYAEEKPRPYKGGDGGKSSHPKKYDGSEEVLRSGN